MDDPGNRPSLGRVVSNWNEYDASFATKLRMAAANSWRRIARLQNCCGNHGQPGC